MNPNIIQNDATVAKIVITVQKNKKNANNCHSANHYVFCYLFCEPPNSIR